MGTIYTVTIGMRQYPEGPDGQKDYTQRGTAFTVGCHTWQEAVRVCDENGMGYEYIDRVWMLEPTTGYESLGV